MTQYGLPLHLVRQIYITFTSFWKRVVVLSRYIKATTDIDSRFPEATPAQLQSDVCKVCLLQMESGRVLPCGHICHRRCLMTWFEHHQSCPYCRHSVVDEPDQQGAQGGAQGNQQPNPLYIQQQQQMIIQQMFAQHQQFLAQQQNQQNPQQQQNQFPMGMIPPQFLNPQQGGGQVPVGQQGQQQGGSPQIPQQGGNATVQNVNPQQTNGEEEDQQQEESPQIRFVRMDTMPVDSGVSPSPSPSSSSAPLSDHNNLIISLQQIQNQIQNVQIQIEQMQIQMNQLVQIQIQQIQNQQNQNQQDLSIQAISPGIATEPNETQRA